MRPTRPVEGIPDPDNYKDKLREALKQYNSMSIKESGVSENYNREVRSDVDLMFCNLEGKQTKVVAVRPRPEYIDREVEYNGETRQVKVRIPVYDGFSEQLSYAFTTGELWRDFSDNSKRRPPLFRFPAERFLKRRQMLGIRSRAGAVSCSCIPGVLFKRITGEPLNVLDPEGGNAFLICGKYQHPTHAIVHYEFNSVADMAEYNERIYQRSDTTILRRGTRIDGVIDIFVLTKLKAKERPSLYRLDESSSSMSPRSLYIPLLESPEEAEVMEPINYTKPEDYTDSEDSPKNLRQEVLEALEEQSDGLEDYVENFGDEIEDFGNEDIEDFGNEATEAVEEEATEAVEEEAIEVVEEEATEVVEEEVPTIPAESAPEPIQAPESPLATSFVFQPASNLTTRVAFDDISNYQIRPGWLKDGDERYLAMDYRAANQLSLSLNQMNLGGLSVLLSRAQMLKELEEGRFYPLEGRFREAPANLFDLQNVAETVQYLPGILSGEPGSDPDSGHISFTLTEEGNTETDSVLICLEVDAAHRLALEQPTFRALGGTSSGKVSFGGASSSDAELASHLGALPPIIRTDIRHRSDVLYDVWYDLGPETGMIGYLVINLTLSERYGFLAPEAIQRL